jgi:hypothetical protein
MDEYREIHPEIRKANAIIKAIMILLDIAYPSENLSEQAFKEKQFLRSKIMDCINNIAKFNTKVS